MSTESIPLSKSQKKRMKRNKAKIRKAENDSTATPELDPFNAHDAMLIGLQKLGYDLADINRTIEEMWNNDLDYSDINNVVAYIEDSKAAVASVAVPTDTTGVPTTTPKTETLSLPSDDQSHVVKSEETPRRNFSEEEMKTVSTSSFSATPPSKTESKSVSPTVQSLNVTKNQIDSYSEVADVNIKTAPHNKSNAKKSSNGNKGSNGHAIKSKVTKKVDDKKPLSLKSKLDIVANNDNLTDAIVALTEWIVKAATPLEVRCKKEIDTLYFFI